MNHSFPLVGLSHPFWQACENYTNIKSYANPVIRTADSGRIIVVRHYPDYVDESPWVKVLKVISWVVLPVFFIIALSYCAYQRKIHSIGFASAFNLPVNRTPPIKRCVLPVEDENPVNSPPPLSNPIIPVTPIPLPQSQPTPQVPKPKPTKPLIDWDKLYTINIPKEKKYEDDPIFSLLDKVDPENTPTKLIDWAERKINGKVDFDKRNNPKYYLHKEIPNHLISHYGLDKKIVRETIFDEDFLIKPVVVTACLELAGAITPKQNDQSAVNQLESLLKEKLKNNLQITDDSTSPVSLHDWKEMPLRNILCLSDKNFYCMEKTDEDFIVLYKQFITDKTRISPITQDKFTDRDYKVFILKARQLNLLPHGVVIDEPIDTQDKDLEVDGTDSEYESATDGEDDPFIPIEKLMSALSSTKVDGDFYAALFPFLDALNQPEVQALKIPDLANKRLGEINIQDLEMHVFAIYLWKALKARDYPFALPLPANLTELARYHKIALY